MRIVHVPWFSGREANQFQRTRLYNTVALIRESENDKNHNKIYNIHSSCWAVAKKAPLSHGIRLLSPSFVRSLSSLQATIKCISFTFSSPVAVEINTSTQPIKELSCQWHPWGLSLTPAPLENMLNHNIFSSWLALMFYVEFSKTLFICIYRWPTARLQYLQCVSNGDTAVLH